MEKFKEKIQKRVSEIFEELVEIRRHIHQHPELAMEEFNTAAYIAAKLDEYGIKYKSGIAVTGILGIIEGEKKSLSKRVVALRADMDALPIKETNELPYKSINEGVMHACGHDMHIACLLGAAKILNEFKKDFSGTVKLIFQPSEEKFPGGALQMIKEGVLENPKPDIVIGQHCLPELECGYVGFRAGKFMASTDEVYITVTGRGGHAATPHLNIDPVLIAAQIIVALQQIVSRAAPPSIPTVLSFGSFIADGKTNIIPDEVNLQGTLRSFCEEWRVKAHIKIQEMVTGIAESMGAKAKVRIDKGYPYLVNNLELTDKCINYSVDYLGEAKVKELDMRMTAEDFAYYSQLIPSCFYRIGVGNTEKGITANLHTSNFNIDENSLNYGAGLLAFITFRELI
ncbi:MAG: amidohydrolase [Bacteroidales bacterium]|nr:amidohydrolase [Bacteroidales bacterium]